jgi:hypothetical protein
MFYGNGWSITVFTETIRWAPFLVFCLFLFPPYNSFRPKSGNEIVNFNFLSHDSPILIFELLSFPCRSRFPRISAQQATRIQRYTVYCFSSNSYPSVYSVLLFKQLVSIYIQCIAFTNCVSVTAIHTVTTLISQLEVSRSDKLCIS